MRESPTTLAAWIVHAELEDRLESAIQHSSASRAGTLNGGIKSLKESREENLSVHGAFHDDILDHIDSWHRERKTKMHELADQAQSTEALLEQFQQLAETGERLAREADSAVMRLKKIGNTRGTSA